MKIKIIYIFYTLLICLNIQAVYAVNIDYYNNIKSAEQLAKIIYKETGADAALNSSENFFMRITTGAVVINNASHRPGSTFYDQLYNLTDNNYQGYSSYKDLSFEQVVPVHKRNEMLYIAQLILSGKYTVPKNMTLQASQSIVQKYGTVWGYVGTGSGYYDVYFGYEGSSLSNTDIFGNQILNLSFDEYKSKAMNYKLQDYSAYTFGDEIKNNNDSNSSQNNNPGINANPDSNSNINLNKKPGNSSVNNNTNGYTVDHICNDYRVLKVFYILKMIVTVIKILVPIILIIKSSIDLAKAVMSDDGSAINNSVKLFIVRGICGVAIFFIPALVETFVLMIGNVVGEKNVLNFSDCIKNANSKKISQIENNSSN